MATKALTVKQENFCIEYVKCGNASEAYRRVYDSKGNIHTVNRSAHELMQNPAITARVEELMKDYGASAGRVIKRLVQGIEFDFRKLYREDGTLKRPEELDDDTAKAVVGVKYDSDGNLVEYKIIDVKGCAELIGKHLKLFTDRVEHGLDDELAAWLQKR